MCDPVSAVMVATTAAGVASDVADNASQRKQQRVNQLASLQDLKIQLGDINARERQEITAASRERRLVQAQGTEALGLVEVSSAEGGVTGNSVDLQRQEIQRDAADALGSLDDNLEITLDQLRRLRTGTRADAQNRINSVSAPSNLATGLRIAGRGLDLYSSFRARSND